MLHVTSSAVVNWQTQHPTAFMMTCVDFLPCYMTNYQLIWILILFYFWVISSLIKVPHVKIDWLYLNKTDITVGLFHVPVNKTKLLWHCSALSVLTLLCLHVMLADVSAVPNQFVNKAGGQLSAEFTALMTVYMQLRYSCTLKLHTEPPLPFLCIISLWQND